MVTRPKLRLARYLVPVIIVLAIIFSIRQCGNQEKPSGHPRDYAAIAKEGILRVATEYNSISFYVDGDTVSGFHYELIQAFAHDKGLKTEITPLMSFEERLQGLSEGRYDVIACGILATSELKTLCSSPLPSRSTSKCSCNGKKTEKTTHSISVASWTWPGGHFT